MNVVAAACGRCGAQVNDAMRFCPSCGKSQSVASTASYLWLAGAAVAVFGVGVGLQYVIQSPTLRVAGPSPAASVEEEHDTSDPQIVALRRELQTNPEDLGKLRIFAGVLGDKIRKEQPASPSLAFEAIDVLSRILRIVPNDPGALVLMADVSFEQRAFTKALEFYQRYLQAEPKDWGARARYASTLTFMSRFDEAVSELNKILANEPKNFPAMAYLAITYHQKGDLKRARQHGDKALTLAPSEEARQRFAGFMEVLKKSESEGVGDAKMQVVSSAAGAAKSSLGQSGVEGLVAAVRANPVAGPKFVRHDSSQKGTLKLVFRDFPMQMMPPFAKDKFLSGIKKSAQEAAVTGVKTVLFVDEATGSVMDSTPLE
jgi:cytochrome c-type biogenesis protein CcmH/NrfG